MSDFAIYYYYIYSLRSLLSTCVVDTVGFLEGQFAPLGVVYMLCILMAKQRVDLATIEIPRQLLRTPAIHR